MFKQLLLVSSLFLTAQVSADFVSGATNSKMYGAGGFKFAVDNPPANTCNYHGRHFGFDATTDAGRNMLSILIAAHMSGKKVDIWFTPSVAPGTDKTSGCTPTTIARLDAVGLQ